MNRFRADLVLLAVALIWGSAFVVQRVAARYYDPFTFNGLRFLLGGLVLLPFCKLTSSLRAHPAQNPASLAKGRASATHVLDRKALIFMVLAGGLLFGAAGLQQAGLETTTAGNAAFITALEVVLVPVLLMAFWREKVQWISWLSAGIAIFGSLLLSTRGTLHLAPGDALVMTSTLLWALHVILVSRAARQMDVLIFSTGQYIVTGVLNLSVRVGMNMPLSGLSMGWWTIVYIGLVSTAVGYTLQVLGQKYAPPTDAAILFSMEAVFAALAGFIFLGERMQPVQLVGCGMIIAAVLLTQLNATRTGKQRAVKD